MNRITDIKTIEYFENEAFNTRHGVYYAKFREAQKVFVVANDIAYALSHFTDKARLETVNDDVRDELFGLLGLKPLDHIKEAT